MKLEYKIKGSDNILSVEIEASSMPSVNIVIDGMVILAIENVDIESVKLSGFVDNFNNYYL